MKDNYGYIIANYYTRQCLVIDPSEHHTILEKIAELGLKLLYILNTHHHNDHIGGNSQLQSLTDAKIVAPSYDAHRIANIDIKVSDSEIYNLINTECEILHIPGHTLGHVAFYFKYLKAIFTGDTLFSLGCGRLFEGSPETMLTSLAKLSRLPDDTLIYCGHEYTENNGDFALSLEASNIELQNKMVEVRRLRSLNLPTIPSTLISEKACNPFLRTNSKEIRSKLEMESANEVEVFAEIRRRKNNY